MTALAIPADPEELDALAGEYVLGVLEARDALAVERALAADAALKRLIARHRLERLRSGVAQLSPQFADQARRSLKTLTTIAGWLVWLCVAGLPRRLR